MDTILNKYKGPSTYRSSAMTVLSKTITMGKVEGSVQVGQKAESYLYLGTLSPLLMRLHTLFLQAVRTALKKLEEGGSIEDAKAVCEPEVLSQIFKWKVLHLAFQTWPQRSLVDPFLHFWLILLNVCFFCFRISSKFILLPFSMVHAIPPSAVILLSPTNFNW